MIFAPVLLQKPNPALASITPGALKAHVQWLSDDARGGRGSLTPGGEASAEYIAETFAKLGAKPLNGTYFQEVPVELRGQDKRSGKARNVVGLIPGSDPKLAGETIILAAHYDHLGTRAGKGDDPIYNGANDDASGVAGVIEAGRALAKMKPGRSVLLIGFCAEELGLVGSRFYADNPLRSLRDTVGLVELEQIGRTDDVEGKREGTIAITGFTFSDLPARLGLAAGTLNVKTEDNKNGDAYFFASDNAALARKGVPAHTVCTAFQFADYHGPADTWEKLDYGNMTRVVKAVAQGVQSLSRGARPKWSETNPKAARFLAAQREQK